MSFNLENFRVKNAPTTIYYIPDFITKEEEKILLNKVYNAPCTKWTVLSHRRLQNWGGLPGPKGMVAEDLPVWLNSYGHQISELGIFEGKVPNHVLVNEYKPGQGIMPHEDGPAFYPTVSTISLGSHTLLDFYYHLNHCEVESACGLQLNSDATPSDPIIVPPKGDFAEECVSQSCNVPQQLCLGTDVPASLFESSGHSKKERETQLLTESSFENRHFLSLLLQPRSLVIVQDEMYKSHLHGIKEAQEDVITECVANLYMVPEVSLRDTLRRSTRVSLTMRFVPKILKARLILGKR